MDGASPQGDERCTDDPARVLDAVLGAMRASGVDAMCVLRPVRDAGGDVRDFDVVADSDVLARMAGRRALGRSLRQIFPPDFADELVTANARALTGGTVVRSDRVVPMVGDRPEPVLGRSVVDPDVSVGEVVRVPFGDYVVVVGRDVTAERKTARALAVSEERLRRLLEHSSDPVLVTDADGVVTWASPATRAVTRRAPESVVGLRFGALCHPEDRDVVARLMAEAASGGVGHSVHGGVRVVDQDGGVRHIVVTATDRLHDPVVSGMVINVRDVTAQLEAERRLQQEAMQDSLTGLPNRRWFLRALTEAARRSTRTGRPFAVLLLDVDDFKGVNDSLGHPVGDQLLVELARRMPGALRDSDTVARLGGDEFIVLAQDLDDAAHAEDLAERLLRHASGEYPLAASSVDVSLSVGVATSDDATTPVGAATAAGAGAHGHPAVDVQLLLQRADAALYAAKRAGRNRVVASGAVRSPA